MSMTSPEHRRQTRWFAALHRLRGAAVLVCLCILLEPAAAAAHNVFVLFSNGRLLPANVEFDQGLRQSLAQQPGLQVELMAEFLDTPRFSGADSMTAMAEYLQAKYSRTRFDVVVAGGPEALAFVLLHRERLFPGVPVIHVSIPRGTLETLGPLPPGVVGVPVEVDFFHTAEQALRWHPSARRLVVVTGSAPWDRSWEARVREESRHLSRPIELELLAGVPTEALKRQLAALGPESIVYTPGYFRDGDGRYTVPRDAAAWVAAATPAPVYGAFTTFVGTGAVGAVAAGFTAMGQLTGRIVADLARGTAPDALALPAAMPMQMHVDWRAARRHGIAEHDLPQDADVQFREPSFWAAYGHWVVIAGAALLVQTLLIALLLLERGRRRRTAAALVESERRMNLASEAARLTTWIWDHGSRKAWFRAPAPTAGSQWREESLAFEGALGLIHPADREAVASAARQALASGDEVRMEYRVAGPGGQWRWMAARGRAEPGGGQRVLGVALDITQRKAAEAQAEQDRAALRHMTRVSLLGQLSASIAHQLNQPLMSIMSNAEAAQQMLAREPVDLGEMREICDDILAADRRAAQVIRSLSALFKRGELQLALLDLNDLVRETLELMRADMLARQVSLVERLAPVLPAIEGDRVQLQQMLLNLVGNAADAMVDMPAERRMVTVATELSAEGVKVCVGDRGPGIAHGDEEKIFEPFWTTKSAGMGVGLAICRSIAAAHGGRLCAANEPAPAGGAVFCVWLPIRAAP